MAAKKIRFHLMCLDGDQSLSGFVVIGVNYVGLHFNGYGEKDSKDEDSLPLTIENHNGVPHVVIWGDIDDEDPTSVISLSGAKIRKT